MLIKDIGIKNLDILTSFMNGTNQTTLVIGQGVNYKSIQKNIRLLVLILETHLSKTFQFNNENNNALVNYISKELIEPVSGAFYDSIL